jgi:hypothetical protein
MYWFIGSVSECSLFDKDIPIGFTCSRRLKIIMDAIPTSYFIFGSNGLCSVELF